ncbi:hypothetical protein [Estrella lausannensis]|uniref:Uncharacterized protein n=1 Tax=Estrella lausannensis TaxID=483423 RepID=A0A0H5DSV5_9BACT|nr:hypothetical protein [Estrella lausannensis]CRX39413.1 hypothetical protein ELAC_2092 [Estrella lausannensis]
MLASRSLQLDGFGFYFEEEEHNLQAHIVPQLLGSTDEKLLTIRRENLNHAVDYEGSVIIYKSTVLSVSAAEVEMTSSSCDGLILSEGNVKCTLSTAKKIDAMGDVDVLRCSIKESIEASGSVKVASLLCPLGLLAGDRVCVKNAEMITTVKGTTALIVNSSVQKAALSDSGTFVRTKILEEISGTACRIELIGSTAKRIIFKKPYFIPGSEHTISAKVSDEYKAEGKKHKSLSFLYPSAKSSESRARYIAGLIDSEVEEIFFDDPEGWCIEFVGTSKVTRVGLLGTDEYEMFDVTL